MKYEEVKAEGYLSNFVKCFWTSETFTKSVEHTILPDGYFDLIVEIKERNIIKIKLTGVWTIPIDIAKSSNTRIFAVRFKPLAAELLEDINLKSLLNTSTIFQKTFLDLDTLSFEHFETFCLHIKRHLEIRIEKTKFISEWKICLFNQIFKKETYNVQELAEKCFFSSRKINRYFNSNFGLSLKNYVNIVRCNSTFKNISKDNLCPESNYYDQSHYIKEVKKITGVTPKELYRNKNDRFLQLLTMKEN
ncbi:MAG: AraC family transcriptional regulator [Ferruginibacter sp.]